jgi:tetratricopeptide (TPR) repeat protein
MLILKNKHLLWAASLCSAGGVLIGASAMLDRSRMATELDGLKATLSQTDREALQRLLDLKGSTDKLIDELEKSIEKLGKTNQEDSGKLVGVSKLAEETNAKLVAISDRVDKAEKALDTIQSASLDRSSDLKTLAAALPRIEEQLKRIEEQQKELVKLAKTNPKEKADANDKKADGETKRLENEPGPP